MQTLTDFNLNCERYAFDSGECATWAQVDTRQDAPYFGNWCDPIGLKFTTFAEGDIYRRTFDDADELAAFLWTYRINDSSMRIDATGDLAAAFRLMGCGDLLHGADKLELPDMKSPSFANIFTESRMVDGFTQEGCGDESGQVEIEVILPDLTPLALVDVAADELKKAFEMGGDADSIFEDVEENYRGSREYYEWADGFWPAMNFLWPVELAYKSEPAQVAALLDKYASTVSLVSVDDGHAFVLTGGGMDLSDQLAAAYLVAGCVPPLRLMESRWAHSQLCDGPLRGHWLHALQRGAEFLNAREMDLVNMVHTATGGRGIEQ